MTNDLPVPLQDRQIGGYLEALASSEPAPGGGSVAGLTGALAAALGEMVANLTRDPDDAVIAARDTLTNLRASALASGEADEAAYGGYVEASKMSKGTAEDKALRAATMQEALQEAATVPLELALTANRILEGLEPVVASGNKHVLSDAEAAIILALACVDISLGNVRVNLPMIRDEETASNLRAKAQHAERDAYTRAEALRERLAQRT